MEVSDDTLHQTTRVHRPSRRRGAAGSGAAKTPAQVARDINGREALVASAPVAPFGWLVLVELPVEEANAPAP